MASTISRRSIQVDPTDIITNDEGEVAFSRKFRFPARELRRGNLVRYGAAVGVVGQDGDDTHQVRIYLGNSGTTSDLEVYDSTATDAAAGTGIYGCGQFYVIAPGAEATIGFGNKVAKSSAVSTLEDLFLTVTVEASSKSTGNKAILEALFAGVRIFEQVPAGGA